jgi:hypothetical protein
VTNDQSWNGSETRRALANVALAHSAIATDVGRLVLVLDGLASNQRRARLRAIAEQLGFLGDTEHETRHALNALADNEDHPMSEEQKTMSTHEIDPPTPVTTMSPSSEAPASVSTQAFWMNLGAFLVGIACQVLSVMFAPLQQALAPIAVLLLSGANVGKVLNGSLWKHGTVFILGVACQVCAVLLPNARSALFAAAGLLLSAADLPTILARLRGQPDALKGTP